MTQERFLRFVENPDLLSTIPYEELKTLALNYPYAANLRVLLFLKSAQEKHHEAERNRTIAATYTLDRRRLFLLTHRIISPAAVEEVEVLELKPLSELPSRDEPPTQRGSIELPPAPPPAESQTAGPPPKTPTPAPDQPPPAPQVPTPAPAEESTTHFFSFAEWASQFNAPTLTQPPPSPATSAPKPKAERSATTGIAQQLAQKSISENPDIASETLARLYAQQGYRDKAIEMYERLMVLHPEKSAFFAAQIEALTKHT